jgi:hypothetical protein
MITFCLHTTFVTPKSNNCVVKGTLLTVTWEVWQYALRSGVLRTRYGLMEHDSGGTAERWLTRGKTPDSEIEPAAVARTTNLHARSTWNEHAVLLTEANKQTSPILFHSPSWKIIWSTNSKVAPCTLL